MLFFHSATPVTLLQSSYSYVGLISIFCVWIHFLLPHRILLWYMFNVFDASLNQFPLHFLLHSGMFDISASFTTKPGLALFVPMGTSSLSAKRRRILNKTYLYHTFTISICTTINRLKCFKEVTEVFVIFS